MYLNKPVKIPDRPGKITFKTHGETRYVQYETGRVYDPGRRYTLVDRAVIGVQIPGRPEWMLPNENYARWIRKEGEETENEKEKPAQAWEQERERQFILREFFEQLYFEFQMISRRRGDSVVNRNKVERLNRVLGPLLDMMAGESYAEFLELIPEPEACGGPVRQSEEGGAAAAGMTYSDVALLLTQYKSAVNRFYQKIR